jgi:hypothetical protein
MDVKVEVGVLTASCSIVESTITVEILSGETFSPVVSDLSFTPTITINGGSISSIPADKILIGVWAA